MIFQNRALNNRFPVGYWLFYHYYRAHFSKSQTKNLKTNFWMSKDFMMRFDILIFRLFLMFQSGIYVLIGAGIFHWFWYGAVRYFEISGSQNRTAKVPRPEKTHAPSSAWNPSFNISVHALRKFVLRSSFDGGIPSYNFFRNSKIIFFFEKYWNLHLLFFMFPKSFPK